jgi:hypothetical protein
MDARRQRYAEGALTEVEPRRSRDTAAVLSDRAQMVCSRMSWWLVRTSGWHTSASCSRSELVMVPLMLSLETRASWISCAKGKRQSSGARWGVVGIQVPPMPKPDASTVPMKVGAESTISAQRVGRAVSSWASQRKSSSWSWTGWERRRRSVGLGFFACRSTDWSWEKRPRPPGIANTMLRSSPSSCCHFRQEVRCWERGMDCKIS